MKGKTWREHINSHLHKYRNLQRKSHTRVYCKQVKTHGYSANTVALGSAPKKLLQNTYLISIKPLDFELETPNQIYTLTHTPHKKKHTSYPVSKFFISSRFFITAKVCGVRFLTLQRIHTKQSWDWFTRDVLQSLHPVDKGRGGGSEGARTCK